MGHSSKKHSHHGRSSHDGHRRAHGDGQHGLQGNRVGRPARTHGSFGFAAASGDQGSFGGDERATAWDHASRPQAFGPRAQDNQGFSGGIDADRRQVSTGDKVARLVLAALALYEAARAFYEDSPRPRAQPIRRPATHAPARISVCTGRSCSRRWDSVSPADDLRQAAAANGQAANVAPSPCMKMCEQGPVVAVASGTSGEQLFVNMRRREIPNIIKLISSRRQ